MVETTSLWNFVMKNCGLLNISFPSLRIVNFSLCFSVCLSVPLSQQGDDVEGI